MRKTNGNIASKTNLEELAKYLKRNLNYEELKALKVKLSVEVFDVNIYIKNIVELLNAKGFKTSFLEFEKDNDYILIENGESLEKIFCESEINCMKGEEKEIYLFNIKGEEKEWKILCEKLTVYLK